MSIALKIGQRWEYLDPINHLVVEIIDRDGFLTGKVLQVKKGQYYYEDIGLYGIMTSHPQHWSWIYLSGQDKQV